MTLNNCNRGSSLTSVTLISMNEKDSEKKLPEKKNPIVSAVVVALGAASAAWLVLPIPDLTDVIPVLGNIDEAAATAIIISCCAYFGLDIGAFFGRFTKDKDAKETRGKVIDE